MRKVAAQDKSVDPCGNRRGQSRSQRSALCSCGRFFRPAAAVPRASVRAAQARVCAANGASPHASHQLRRARCQARHVSRRHSRFATRIIPRPRHLHHEKAHIARHRLCPACSTTTHTSSRRPAATGLRGRLRRVTSNSNSPPAILRCMARRSPLPSLAHPAPISPRSSSTIRTLSRLRLHSLGVNQAIPWS